MNNYRVIKLHRCQIDSCECNSRSSCEIRWHATKGYYYKARKYRNQTLLFAEVCLQIQLGSRLSEPGWRLYQCFGVKLEMHCSIAKVFSLKYINFHLRKPQVSMIAIAVSNYPVEVAWAVVVRQPNLIQLALPSHRSDLSSRLLMQI